MRISYHLRPWGDALVIAKLVALFRTDTPVQRFILGIALALLPCAALAAKPPPPPLSLADAAAIAAELGTAPAQGLTAPDVSADVAALVDPNPAARAAADARLTRAAIAYAAAEHGMDLNPHAVDPNFALRPNYDAAADFARARASGTIGAWLTGLTRTDPSYVDLLAARARYTALAASGGWQPIPAGAPLKVGAHDPRVPALLQRLTAEGYTAATAPPSAPAAASNATNATNAANAAAPAAAAAPDPQVFDAGLSAAVADFQTHHALGATGELDAATVKALNVPVKDRLAAIDINLERARWLPVVLPPLRIEADIAGPQVTLFVDDKPQLTMRAVAGSPSRETPSFASAVNSVEFNPPWYVPADIARREILPKGPAYLARNDMVVRNGTVMQRAGPQSALGYVKFDISDPFAVYLHDTPSRGAFASNMRWRSHGCMRLQMPRELAAALLGWTPAQVDAAIAAKATRFVALKDKPAVYLIYRTADAGDDGKVTFRADVYGWDAELAAAMAGHPMAPRHAATVAGA